jgi:hypothetical protein
MGYLITNSTDRISNLTSEMEHFIIKIHTDIDRNYASVRNILNVMNEGLQQLLTLQQFIVSEISSVQGMTYFLCVFLALLFICSFKKFYHKKGQCLLFYTANLIL